MKIIYPLTFKFGELGIESISEDDKTFYHFIASSILKAKNIKWANEKFLGLSNLFVTTPISKKDLQENPNHISNLFIEWCNETARIIDGGVINNPDTILLINIQGKGRHKQIGHLSNTLVHLLTYETDFRVILLVNNNPIEGDIQFEPLLPFIKKKILCILDKNGVFYTNNLKIVLDTAKFSELGQKRVPRSYDIIGKRIIRRVGHFKVKPYDEICNRFFYDGMYCGEELKELILDYIFQNVSNPKDLEYIVYSAEHSPWLEKALFGVSGDIKADYIEELPSFKKLVSITELEGGTDKLVAEGGLMLVVDFVNTGKTLQDLIETVKNEFVCKNSEKLNIVSILNNIDGEVKQRVAPNRRSIIVNGDPFEFTYFADVRIKTMDSKTECDCCKLGMDWTDILDVNSHSEKLKSIDFWYLSDQNEYKPEDNIPHEPPRAGLELVPKFENWLTENATFLAFKFRKFIESYKLSNSIDFILVFPIEPSGNNVAYLFALKLKELFNYDIIGIPRLVIDKVKNEELTSAQIGALHENWVGEIKSKTKRVDFVILDEFHNKGGTFASIRRILNSLGNPPKSYFVLADFNPEKSQGYVSNPANFKVYSLYEFNYN